MLHLLANSRRSLSHCIFALEMSNAMQRSNERDARRFRSVSSLSTVARPFANCSGFSRATRTPYLPPSRSSRGPDGQSAQTIAAPHAIAATTSGDPQKTGREPNTLACRIKRCGLSWKPSRWTVSVTPSCDAWSIRACRSPPSQGSQADAGSSLTKQRVGGDQDVVSLLIIEAPYGDDCRIGEEGSCSGSKSAAAWVCTAGNRDAVIDCANLVCC